jgi:hypothetical protein
MLVFQKLGNYGRLGNQMFQIASTAGIAIKNKTDYAFPAWNYSQYFKGEFPILPDLNFQTYTETSPYYEDIVLDNSINWNLEGYFQSWKYFDHCKELILDLFDFERKPVDAVAIHVRRGDYLNLQHTHPILEMEYYRSAMEHFLGEHFTVFSDDIQWCIDNLPKQNVEYSTNSTINPIEDFKHMSSHRGFIIANSSFSFWAAYLSQSKDVIAPKKYVAGEDRDDRIPPEWIKF